MKRGLLSGSDRDAGAVRQDKLGVGIFLYIVKIDDKRLMYLIEEQGGHFFAQLVEITADRKALVYGFQNDLSVGPSDVEDVVDEYPLLRVVPIEENVHIRPVNIFHGLVKPGIQSLHIKRLGKEAESVYIHGVVLVLIVVCDEKERDLAVALFQFLSQRDSVHILHLDIQKGKIKTQIAGKNLAGGGRRNDIALDQPVIHIFLNMDAQGIEILDLVVAN